MRPSCPAPTMPMVIGRVSASTGSGWARTLAVCSARNFLSAASISGRLFARMAAAARPALVAPATPMANVATGMPAGICTMDSSESRPLSAFDCTGTPSTGSVVLEAVMPGRWAAPPAPAMITSMPRACARRCVFEQQVGRAVGGDDAGLVGDAELVERLGRGAHRLPVGSRAHDDADQWFHREILASSEGVRRSSNKSRSERNSSRDARLAAAGSTRSLVALVMSACRALRSASGRHFSELIERRRTFGEQPRAPGLDALVLLGVDARHCATLRSAPPRWARDRCRA